MSEALFCPDWGETSLVISGCQQRERRWGRWSGNPYWLSQAAQLNIGWLDLEWKNGSLFGQPMGFMLWGRMRQVSVPVNSRIMRFLLRPWYFSPLTNGVQQRDQPTLETICALMLDSHCRNSCSKPTFMFLLHLLCYSRFSKLFFPLPPPLFFQIYTKWYPEKILSTLFLRLNPAMCSVSLGQALGFLSGYKKEKRGARPPLLWKLL